MIAKKLFYFIAAQFSVLKTFIHDPLVEWEKVKGKTGNAESLSSNEKVIMCTQYSVDTCMSKHKTDMNMGKTSVNYH